MFLMFFFFLGGGGGYRTGTLVENGLFFYHFKTCQPYSTFLTTLLPSTENMSPTTLDTGRKLNVENTKDNQRRPRRFLNALCMFSLRSVFRDNDGHKYLAFVNRLSLHNNKSSSGSININYVIWEA